MEMNDHKPLKNEGFRIIFVIANNFSTHHWILARKEKYDQTITTFFQELQLLQNDRLTN